MDDKTRALLGDQEAAKRLTDAGMLLECKRCGSENVDYGEYDGILVGLDYVRCRNCGLIEQGVVSPEEFSARLEWNTRAPILSAEEMEMLEALKDGKGD